MTYGLVPSHDFDDVQRLAIEASSSGNTTLLAAQPGKRIRVLQYTLVVSAAVTVKFTSSAGGDDLTGDMAFTANSGASPAFSPVGHFETNTGEALVINLDAAEQVGGHLTVAVV